MDLVTLSQPRGDSALYTYNLESLQPFDSILLESNRLDKIHISREASIKVCVVQSIRVF
jgi:hypothetical protein